jgi:hypothetical protein
MAYYTVYDTYNMLLSSTPSISQLDPTPQEQRQVSDVRASGDREDIEDRYYTSDEYRKLTAEQKFDLKKRRERRGGGRKSDYRKQFVDPDKSLRPTKKTQYNKHHPLVKVAVTAARRQFAAMSMNTKENTEQSESEEKSKHQL